MGHTVGKTGEVHDCTQEEEVVVVAAEVGGVIAPSEVEVLDMAEYLEKNINNSTLKTVSWIPNYTHIHKAYCHMTHGQGMTTDLH